MNFSRDDRIKRLQARKDAQERNLFGRISAAALGSRKQAARLLRSVGKLSITEWRVLWDLSEAGPLTVTEMASIQRTDHALISRSIPSMVEKGYVATITSEDDRRKSLIALTALGSRIFEETSATMSARRNALADHFTPSDLEIFLELITRFEQFVEDTQTSVKEVKSTQ